MRPTSRDMASTAPCFWSASIAILASSRNSILAPTRKTGSCIVTKSAISASYYRARARYGRHWRAILSLFRMGRCFAHAGIVSRVAPLAIIHAFAVAKRVVEDIIQNNAELSARMKTAKFASIWGEEC